MDQMGLIPQFLIERNTKYKTLTGGFLSLILMILYILACILFGQELYLKQNPTMVISKIYQEEPELFNLTQKNFGFFIGLQGSDYEYYIDPTIYNLNMRIRSKKTYLDDNGQFVNDKYNTKNFKLEKCNLDKHFSNFKKQFKDQDLNNLLCPPSEVWDIQLKGSFDNSDYRWFDFSVSVCKNKTDSAIICKSKEEIDKKLQGGFFVINYVDTIFDHNNYKEPYKYVRKNFYTSMSNKFIKSMTFWLRNVEYTTDSGIFFADEETKKFVNTEDIKEYYDMREADKFIGAVFRLSYTQETIKRRYLKIPVVIAEVGGFMKGINIILSLLFYFYTKMDFYSYLINKIYFLDSDDKINQNQNILQSQIKKLKTIKNSEHNKINASSQHNMQNLNQIEHLKLNLKRNNDQSQRPNSRVIQNEGNLKNQDDYDYSAEYITLTKRFRSNKETKKDFGIFDKLCIIIKMCFPFRKTELEGQKATYYSLDQIMNKFDCIRYLKNFEEIRIIKNIFMEEENIKIIDNLVNYKKKPENEIENQSNMENIDLKESLKNILSSNKSQNIKLKDMIKNYGLI